MHQVSWNPRGIDPSNLVRNLFFCPAKVLHFIHCTRIMYHLQHQTVLCSSWPHLLTHWLRRSCNDLSETLRVFYPFHTTTLFSSSGETCTLCYGWLLRSLNLNIYSVVDVRCHNLGRRCFSILPPSVLPL